MSIALTLKTSFLPLQSFDLKTESSQLLVQKEKIEIESISINKRDKNSETPLHYFKHKPLVMSVETSSAQAPVLFPAHNEVIIKGIDDLSNTSDLKDTSILKKALGLSDTAEQNSPSDLKNNTVNLTNGSDANGTTDMNERLEHQDATNPSTTSALKENATPVTEGQRVEEKSIEESSLSLSEKQPINGTEGQATETSKDATPPVQNNLNGFTSTETTIATFSPTPHDVADKKAGTIVPPPSPEPVQKPTHLTMPIPGATKLKRLLEETSDLIVCPGVYDGLSARVALEVGFNAMYMVSFCPENSTRP